MIRGTTPTHEFTLPFTVDLISEVEITYKQSNTCLLVKHSKDCTLEDNKISVRLSQKETFKFAKGGTVSVQVRVLTTGGDVLASDIHRVNCDDCLSEGVLK